MRFRQWNSIPSLFALFALLSSGIAPSAGAATAYAITATDVTMPMSGNGASSYTVVGIPITGSLVVSCQYSGSSSSAQKIPLCGGGPVYSTPVNQGQTVTGMVTFYPYGSPMPLDREKASRNGTSTVILSLTGAVLFGFGFGRRFRGRLSALLLVLGAFAILPAISACGGGYNGMTPGTYQYTITAGNSASLNPLSAGTSTTVTVTVP
jgi:hypothetical protein